MSLEEQMNALTRLLIATFMILLLFNFKYSGVFLAASIAFVIIIYYVTKRKMDHFSMEQYTQSTRSNQQTDNYKRYNLSYSTPKCVQPPQNQQETAALIARLPPHAGPGTANTVGMNLPSAYIWCNDETELEYNQNFVSKNQQLAGPANPKTRVQPIVVPPSADLNYWKANNLITHSAINEQTQFDAYRSGYQVSTCCGSLIDKELVPSNNPYAYEVPLTQPYQNPVNYAAPLDEEVEVRHREDFSYPYLTTAPEVWPAPVMPNESGQVNTACGYNPQQIFTAGLPSNLTVGNCQKDPAMRLYNENMFTQTVMPGVYSNNQINEPINSNIGISFNQQLQPTTCSTDDNGNVMYIEHDPRIIEPALEEPNLGVIEGVNVSNIYDPRHTGYGTSYRSYIDETTGQPRFYYDDIDSVKMPNYITRSNIDFTPFADSYGPAPADGAFGNPHNSNIRALANDTFTRNTIQQRTDIATSLMRKKNAEGWQRRMAPIHTGYGGMSCK